MAGLSYWDGLLIYATTRLVIAPISQPDLQARDIEMMGLAIPHCEQSGNERIAGLALLAGDLIKAFPKRRMPQHGAAWSRAHLEASILLAEIYEWRAIEVWRQIEAKGAA